jgi:hypothetical protein
MTILRTFDNCKFLLSLGTLVDLSLHFALDPGKIGRNFTGQARSVNLRAGNVIWLRFYFNG